MLALAFQFYCIALFGLISHTDQGAEYGEYAVAAYTQSNHGVDGSLFLDPYFKQDIENLNDKKVLDAGCGAAPWSIYAAQQGGEVYAIDIQESMIQAAKNAVEVAKLAGRIFITKGDVAKLPYKDNFFDKAISICVGCNLPPSSFERHFIELKRTLKQGGIAVVGAPTSLEVVFSNGSKAQEEIYSEIQSVLFNLPNNPSTEIICQKLNSLGSVLGATFFIKNDRLALVSTQDELPEGEKIWRKLPKLVVPNRYYSQEHYINIFKKYGFEIQKIDLPYFKSDHERVAYNSNADASTRLGQEYVMHAPFVIFHIKKADEK